VIASSQTRERPGETARSTATSTFAVDDLLDDLELPGGCFFWARRRRAPAGEWGVEREQMSGGKRVPEGVLMFYITGWVWSRVHQRWMLLGIMGGGVGRHCALSPGVG
jgi:hypothetical protein